MANMHITAAPKLSEGIYNLRRRCQNSKHQLIINMALIFLGCTFDLLNVAGVISVIEDLGETYGLEYTTASWALTSYAITFAGLIAFMGRLGDIIGNSVLFTISGFFFSLFCLLCAVVTNFPAFAVLRALQGIAAAGLVPCGYALIPTLADPEDVQLFFAVVSCGFSSTIGIGLIIGGAFALTNVGYKGIFYLSFAGMLLVSIAAFFFTYRIEEQKFAEQDYEGSIHRPGKIASLDFVGSLIFISGSVLIVVGLTEGGESWKRPVAYVPFTIGMIFFCGFFAWNCSYQNLVIFLKKLGCDTSRYLEKVQVLIPRDVLFMTNFIPITLGFLCNGGCLYSNIYIIDQYSQYVDKNSPLLAGVKLVPLIITMVIGNTICASKSVKLRPRIGVALGFLSMVCGSIILIQLHLVEENLYWKIMFCSQILVGFGAAIFYPYALKLVVGDAPSGAKGIASGVTQTFAQLGIEMTFSVMVSVLGNITQVKSRPDSFERFRDGFQKCTYFTLASGAFGLVLTTFFVREPRFSNGSSKEATALENGSYSQTESNCEKKEQQY